MSCLLAAEHRSDVRGALELWGGVECSVTRINNRWRDQTRETGHHDRDADLDLIADLGIRTLRYPVLWERCAPGPSFCGWAWHDHRLHRLRSLGIRPIVGLLHHGSGPPGNDLLDPHLPEALADHAAAVADRYPWVELWTPVNEPLTTARFSGLYGFWHPHRRDEAAFLMMLAVQCRAVLLSMRSIRKRLPNAKLVQTEDVGRVFSTDRLAYQADYENQRRWLSFDLLCGHVDWRHAWHRRLLGAGVPERWLDEFLDGESAPHLIGANHYVTSDRYLDHRIAGYPAHLAGGNGRETYVDTEAVRGEIARDKLCWRARLEEIWRRYQRPMAITEAHLGCDDEAQRVSWLLEAWNAALSLRSQGADIRAVTSWALFGCVDWNSLLRESNGNYEPGVWNAGASQPRTTRLTEIVARLADGVSPDEPERPGWWRIPEHGSRLADAL